MPQLRPAGIEQRAPRQREIGGRAEPATPAEIAETTINGIFGAGLHLAAAASMVEGPARDRIERSIEDLDALVTRTMRKAFVGTARADTTDRGALLDDALAALGVAEQVLGTTLTEVADIPGTTDATGPLTDAATQMRGIAIAMTTTLPD